MTKDTFYFSHDHNSRTDPKIKRLLARHGMQGYGIFWAIVEDLYNNANALQTDYETIAFDLRVDASVVQSIIEDFNLFTFDGEMLWSASVERRLIERNNKSEKARQSALSRWNKKPYDANAMRTHSDSNAIKERKGKESKVKKSIIKGENEKNWKNDFDTYIEEMRTARKELFENTEWLEKQQSFNPGVDIKKSIDKSCVNYWATEAGWKNKKRKQIKTVDWKATFANAISSPQNRVYLPR
jgi:hypothetical protein